MNKIILNLVRIVFLGLIIFETLNLFDLLHFKLDYSWLGLILTAVGVWILMEILNFQHIKRIGAVIPAIISIVPLASILIDALGDILGLYSRFEWYDQLAHFTGGITTATAVYFAVKVYLASKNIEIGRKFMGVFSVFGTAFFASMYEIEEYSETYLLKNNRLGDRMDTPNDLMLTILGGLILSFGITVYLKYRNK